MNTIIDIQYKQLQFSSNSFNIKVLNWPTGTRESRCTVGKFVFYFKKWGGTKTEGGYTQLVHTSGTLRVNHPCEPVW